MKIIGFVLKIEFFPFKKSEDFKMLLSNYMELNCDSYSLKILSIHF